MALLTIPAIGFLYFFKNYKVGTKVNLETDMFARYIYNMFKKDDKKNLSWDDVDKVMARY